MVNTSRAKKLEKSHDPLALVAHTGSSSRQTSSHYVTHPTSMVDYDDEYQQDDVHNNSEDPLVSAMDIKEIKDVFESTESELDELEKQNDLLKDQLLEASLKQDVELSSSSVPWIYMAQFWHTSKEDRSKYRLKFMLDKKELNLTLDDFKTIFHLLQATDNNHNSFVPPPSFSEMVPFYKQVLGFIMELKTPSSFKTTGLL
ncbi:hypothetical protein Tco_0154364 [Tanacetum coccineum]